MEKVNVSDQPLLPGVRIQRICISFGWLTGLKFGQTQVLLKRRMIASA